MVIRWDTDVKRHYTKIGNSPKVYINDARNKRQFKPKTRYLKELEKKTKDAENEKKISDADW